MFEKIAHIGVAVSDLEAAVELFTKLFNAQPQRFEEVRDQKVKTVMFEFNGAAIELLQATSPESSIAKFIEKRGTGVHHISFVVDDIEREMKRLKEIGFELVDEAPRYGAGDYIVAFLHPHSTNGVLIEISQKRAPSTGR
ncbi:MAG: methylmalonyl-CoA epimerase [Ignavibacteriales bacterium]|nr:methylmalonyl-CoA epimerase [Ignavibacteriales bacterium]